jgi:hypothetical protein
VLSPVVRGSREHEPGVAADRLAELEVRKEEKYRDIRDAESDLHAGKLSHEDHRAIDRALRREAIAILEEIDRVNEGSSDGERTV